LTDEPAEAVVKMAKQKSEEKILRIGIVQGGRIIEERLLRTKEPVTVGQSPRNKFMIPSPRVPISYVLINVKSGGYVLQFEKGMLGKVLVNAAVQDLKAIAQAGLAERKKNRFFLPLSETSRGKIVLGDVTLLFQFVTPPPAVPKLQLPAEAKGSWWRNIDRPLAISLLLTFLVLGGSGGGMDVWWRQTGQYLAPVKQKKSTVFQTLVTAQKKDAEKDEKDKVEGETDKKDEGISESQDEAKETKDDPSRFEELRIGEEQALDGSMMGEQDLGAGDLDLDSMGENIDMDSMAERVADNFKQPESTTGKVDSSAARMERAKLTVSSKTVVSVMGSDFGVGPGNFADSSGGRLRRSRDSSAFGEFALGGNDGVASDFLTDDDGIGSVAAEMSASMGPNGMGPGGGPKVGSLIGPRPEDLDLGGGPGKEVIKGPKTKIQTKKPKVVEKKWKLSLSRARGFRGKIDKAAINSHIKARQSAFQRCYAKVARKNPNVGGKLVLRIKIDMSGRATARVVSDQTGDPRLAQCIVKAIQSWGFPKPDGGSSAEFTIPLVFRTL